jgi:hypothetical protein
MPEFLTNNTIKSALAAASAGEKTYSVSDKQMRGLQIRVQKSSITWSVRTKLHGKQRRYELGRVTNGEDDAGAICLKTARNRAFKVKEMCEAGMSPARQIKAWAIGGTVQAVEAADAAKPLPSWEWDAAVKKFVDWNRTYRREKSAEDYEEKLADVVEMHRFRGRQVNTLTRNEIMEAIAAINERGVWATACGTHRVVRRFMNWLAESDRQNETNVAANIMLRTKPPEKPANEVGMNDHKRRSSDYDDEEDQGDAPPEIELGRALVIARSGVLKERTGLGLELLFATCQRRRAVVTSTEHRFRAFADTSEQLWMVPPYFRKSGSKRGSTFHLVPCVSWCSGVVTKLSKLCVDGNPFNFPAVYDLKKDGENHHGDIEMFNRSLESMPGVNFSPHGARYGFAEYGERDLGFEKSEGKVVLDHMEGTDPRDVTGNFYSSDPAILRKREMLTLWTAWLDKWAAIAIEQDPLLLDRDHLAEAIFRKKYGKKADEMIAIRIKYREARGWPMWGADKKQEAAE